MSAGLVAFVGIVYFVIAIEQFWKRNPNMGILFLGYALANVGLYRAT